MTDAILEVTYGQIAVFETSLDRPFNEWLPAHGRQGFSWRPGSVSFATLEAAGPLKLGVYMKRQFNEATSIATRVIQVPLTISSGVVEVVAIHGGISFDVPQGIYQVTFEHGFDVERGMWANLFFRSCDAAPAARVVRAGGLHDVPETLLMSARPG